MAAIESTSPASLRAQIVRWLQNFFRKERKDTPPTELNRMKWLHNRYNCVEEQLSVTPIPIDEKAEAERLAAQQEKITRWSSSIERQIQKRQSEFAPESFVSSVESFEPPESSINMSGDNHLAYELSDSARQEILRLEQEKQQQLVSSYSDVDPDTLFVDQWNCSGSSLLAITQELLPFEKAIAGCSSLTEEGDESETKELEAAEPAPQATPAKPSFNSPKNPYQHYSDTALTLLAQNPSTQRSALVWLSYHSNADVRSAVARNPNCPLETLSYLAKDGEAGIRHAIADNPKSSISILELLAVDKNPLIAWRAQNSLNAARGRRTVTDLKPPAWKSTSARNAQSRTGNHLPYSEELAATEETINFLKLIARKSSTPPRRLAELARHPDVRVRAAVAENANSPLELIWLLSRDQSPEVKLKVTENYNCPQDVLETLKDDVDPYVSWQARSVLHRLNNNSGQPPTPFVDNSVINSSTRTRAVTSRELP